MFSFGRKNNIKDLEAEKNNRHYEIIKQLDIKIKDLVTKQQSQPQQPLQQSSQLPQESQQSRSRSQPPQQPQINLTKLKNDLQEKISEKIKKK